MGGRARSGIVRPGAGEAYVEGVFDLPDGLLDDPELAEIAERLPEGSTELVIGQAGVRHGPDERLPGRSLRGRAGPPGAGLPAARLLRAARAPQV
jgi:DNA repair protein RecN (Recombination protein N)